MERTNSLPRVNSSGEREVLLDKWGGFFFSFDLEGAIMGTLAGSNGDESLGFRETISHALLFPGPTVSKPSRKRVQSSFIPPVCSLLQTPLIWHFGHFLSTFFLNHFRAIFTKLELSTKSRPLFVNRRKPALPVWNPIRQEKGNFRRASRDFEKPSLRLLPQEGRGLHRMKAKRGRKGKILF